MSATSAAPEVVVDGRVTVICLGPQFRIIDETCIAGGLSTAITSIAEKAEPPLVVLDLSSTQFFGSSFIELMFRVWNQLQARNGRFAICGLNPHCHDVLKVTHLDSLWPITETRSGAVAELSSACPAE